MSAMNKTCHAPKADLRAPVVLVAEDEILIRITLTQHLRNAGFRIIEASNAQEAMDIFDSGENVDVLFTDIRMPGDRDGIRLAHWVKQNHPDVRIVFASGERDIGDIVQGTRLFSKPYDLEEVVDYIRSLLMDAE